MKLPVTHLGKIDGRLKLLTEWRPASVSDVIWLALMALIVIDMLGARR